MATKQKSKIPKFDIDKVHIDDIVIINASIDNVLKVSALPATKKSVEAAFNFEAAINGTGGKVKLTLDIAITVREKESNDILVTGKFEISYVFDVRKLEVDFETIEPEDEKSLMISLMSIVYSTSRGIIYTRSQGTVLNRFFLPVLSNKRLEQTIFNGYDEMETKRTY